MNNNRKQINLLDLINQRNIYLNKQADDMGANEISELHMHKSLFIIFGQFGVKFNKNLFECDFQAWKYGPVEMNYRSFYKTNDIDKKNIFNIDVNDKELSYLKRLIDVLIKTSPWYLIELTHSMRAWYENYDENDKTHNRSIPSDQIIKSTKESQVYSERK